MSMHTDGQTSEDDDRQSAITAGGLCARCSCWRSGWYGSRDAGRPSTETTATTTATTASTTTSVTEATTTTAAPTTTASTVAKLDKLTLVAPPGPMAIPLAYMAVNDKLADVAEKTELVIWENADQLKAMVAGEQGDFVTMPSNTSAIFYNKGLKLQLLDISVWNITYLVTTDPDAKPASPTSRASRWWCRSRAACPT